MSVKETQMFLDSFVFEEKHSDSLRMSEIQGETFQQSSLKKEKVIPNVKMDLKDQEIILKFKDPE